MKKTTLLTALFLVFSFMGFAQDWHGITSDSPTTMKKTLVSSTESEIVVNVHIDGFYTQSVTTPNGKQMVVSVDKMASMLEAGAPDLPMEAISAVIGDRAEMKVSVVSSSYVDFENIEVAPSKGNFSRQIDPNDVPYTYGEMYSQDAFWPATQAYLDAPYILRDFRGQNIMVRPFAYNPVTKTLRVYTDMTIAMTKVSDNGENQKVARRSAAKVSPEFKAAYDRRFINSGESEAKYPWIEDNGEMLVICADQFMTGMQPFVDWKNQSGRPTTMVSVTAAGGNNADAIKSYITNMYNDPNHNLVYVLLVGDYADITPHPFTYSSQTQYSDIWFGMVEGTDYYEEVFVGRFSVQNDAQVATHVNKVLYYERDMPAGTTWVNKGLGIGAVGAGSGHYGEDDYQHIDYIRDTLVHYTYGGVTELHQNGGSVPGAQNATAAGISNTINTGVSIINYCNHGSETSWGVCDYSTSNVNALTNDNMWPVVWSVACLNGKFNYGSECFAEAWMRATDNSTGVPTGAVGGMFSWISQPWIPPMYGQDEMVDILTGWRHTDQFNHTLAGTSLHGAMFVLDKGSSSEYTATQHSWILFGDPTLMVRTDNPTEMNVTAGPSTLMLGMTDLEITADADFAIVTLSMDGEVLASGNLVNGACTLTFPALSNVGMAQLVVLGYNRVTYMGEVEVVPAEGAYITINSYEMNVPQANYGETIDMNIEVKNVGVEIANNLTATLSTESEYINIINAESAIATINPNQVLTVEGYQFSVAPNVPDGTRAEFFLDVTDGTNAWQGKINVELHAPVIEIESIVEGVQPAPGNPFLNFTFKNNGSAAFNGAVFNIYSSSPLLDFEYDTMELNGVVEPGSTIEVNAPYSVDPTAEEGTTFEIAYELTSGMYNCEGDHTVSYGAIMEDFESGTFGPEWTLSAQYPWTIVDGGTKGTKCAKSTNAGIGNSEGYMELSVNVLAAGNLTFMYKVSSEMSSYGTMYDKLTFYMDGQQKGQWAGTVDWTEFSQAVTTGQHTFKWSYSKDGSVNSGEDCAWIDNIVFPPTNVITFIDPAKDLEATVEGMTVSLTWVASDDADSYLIKRDDEVVATVTTTSYSEVVAEGNYKYSVFAVQGSNMSKPVVAMVVVEFDYFIENQEVAIRLYPNPASEMLNVIANANNFEYQLINSIGQVVVSGNAEGSAQIRVSDMNSGVYFLKVVANGDTKIQKVIIK